MKQLLKKALFTLALVATLCSLALSLVSCGGATGGVVTVVIESAPVGSESIETESYEVDVEKITGEGLVGVFEYLRESEDVAFTMDGTMVSRVGNLTNDYESGVYIYLYTSVEADQDVSTFKTTKEYDGMTLVSSGVGILDMSAPDGAVIYVGTIKYGS